MKEQERIERKKSVMARGEGSNMYGVRRECGGEGESGGKGECGVRK